MAGLISVALLGFVSASYAARRAGRSTRLEGYSFTQFTRDFERSYHPASEEFQHRAALFEASLAEVHTTNAKNAKEGRGWVAGVHPFMDWTPAERRVLNGYKPSRTRSQRSSARMVSLLHQGATGSADGSASSRLNTTREGQDFWSASGLVLRQQGNCGSCWAISAVEAVEAQLLRQGAPPGTQLSAQALVDCVPNPQHCGGTGGCDGATGELAYAFMQEHGIPLESDLPYEGKTRSCPQAPLPGAWQSTRRARVNGWIQLPSNQAEPLKSALVQSGPVVVAVDGNNWFNYDSGIFDSCDKDAVLGHAVLAKGFGEDAGKKYWQIQNSWGSDWGEGGHIRMLMHESEENWCGVDRKPQEGVGCDGGPAQVTVCGMCGILYDPIQPTGVRLDGDAKTVSLAAAGMESSMAEDATTNSAGESTEAQMDDLLRKFRSS